MENSLEHVTRRIVLSFTQKVFDPVGFTCLVTLAPKLWLQEAWKHNLSWDAEVPEEVRKQFQ